MVKPNFGSTTTVSVQARCGRHTECRRDGLPRRAGHGRPDLSFHRSIASLSIRQGVVTQQLFLQKQQESRRLETLVRQAGQIKKISVRLLPDESCPPAAC